MVEVVRRWEYLDYGDAAAVGYNFGSGLADRFNGIVEGFEMEELLNGGLVPDYSFDYSAEPVNNTGIRYCRKYSRNPRCNGNNK